MANIPVINVMRGTPSIPSRLGSITCVIAGIRLRAAMMLLWFVLMLYKSLSGMIQVLRVWISVNDHCVLALQLTLRKSRIAIAI